MIELLQKVCISLELILAKYTSKYKYCFQIKAKYFLKLVYKWIPDLPQRWRPPLKFLAGPASVNQ